MKSSEFSKINIFAGESSKNKINRIFLLDKFQFFFLLLFFLLLPVAKSAGEILFIFILSLSLFKKFLSSKFNIKDYLPKTEINLVIGIFLLICLISTFNSLAFKLSFRAFLGKWVQYALLYFLIVETINCKFRLNRLLFTLSISSFLVGLDGLFQYIRGRDFLGLPLEAMLWMTGPYKANNTLGMYLVLVMPLIFIFALQNRKLILRLMLLFILAILLLCLFLSFSASSWIGLSMGIILSSILTKPKKGILLLVFVFFFWSLLVISPLFKERALQVINPVSIKNLYGRLPIWMEVVKEIEKNPFLGKGINTFRTSILKNYNPFLSEVTAHTHSLYLQIAFEMGLLGLLSFLLIVGKTLMLSVRFIKSSFLMGGVFVSLSSFLIIGLFDTHYDMRIQCLFWMILALIQILMRLKR